MMVNNSQQQTEIMTVLRSTARLGGGIGGWGTAACPILTVCTTTHPGPPHIGLGFGGGIGMVLNIPSKQQL